MSKITLTAADNAFGAVLHIEYAEWETTFYTKKVPTTTADTLFHFITANIDQAVAML